MMSSPAEEVEIKALKDNDGANEVQLANTRVRGDEVLSEFQTS